MDFQGCKAYLETTIRTLMAVDSPTGYTGRAADTIESLVKELGYPVRRTNKGNVIITVEGREDSVAVGICAHLDTLGLMVRSIDEDGRLMLTSLGSPLLPSLDGEYCNIYTRDGRVYTGTILSQSPAVHVFPDAATRPRDEKNMMVRIDERVTTMEETLALGIRSGDYVCYDPKTQITPNGFVKSRFIDDKGSVSVLMTLLKLLRDSGEKPRYTTQIAFTVHEEVGHGGATLPKLDELLVVDMGCVGDDMNCSEYQVSICAKDSSGPFDYDFVSRLVSLAQENGIDYAVDIYPSYMSDAAAAWRSGNDVRAALIGQGVNASHGMERTHLDGMMNTMRLIAHYLDCK